LFATQAKSGVAVVICGEAVVEYDFWGIVSGFDFGDVGCESGAGNNIKFVLSNYQLRSYPSSFR
jgi:hypothetical protein